ncbi:hypothetical protein [Streptomyces sp. NPDC014995]|uniref:hypothetical protein n=1 Tax=Streptomyces sp. NPDC014995 TaxID=3364936 RepID=UPI0036FDB0CB
MTRGRRPGRAVRDVRTGEPQTPVTDIATPADRVLDALLPRLAREPRPAFSGPGMGATVAFEVAPRIRREGLAPAYRSVGADQPPDGGPGRVGHVVPAGAHARTET